MQILFYILLHNIVPLFVIIILGVILGKWRQMDVKTLGTLILYVIVPATIFVQIYEIGLESYLIKALLFSLLYMFVCWGCAWGVSRIRRYSRGMTGAFINQQIFINSGNFGLPLLILVFSSAPYIVDGETPYLGIAVAAQTMVMSLQSVLPTTMGMAILTKKKQTFKEVIARILHVPALYAVPAALLLRLVPYDLTGCFLWPGVEYLRKAMIGVCLLTVGIQFSKFKLERPKFDVLLSSGFRLFFAPVLAYVLLKFLSIQGAVAQALLISSAVPSALMVIFIAVECDIEPEYTTQSVLCSMLLCPITLTTVVYVSRLLFPLTV